MSVADLPALGLLMAASAFAGLLAGLFGVGGGIVLVPAFFFVFNGMGYGGDQVMQICIATSLASIAATSARSVWAHHKRNAVDWSILRGWAPGIAIGAVVGVTVAARLRSEMLVLVFGVLATCVGLYLAFAKVHWRLGNEMPRAGVRGMLSLGVGFFSALVGIGGGSFGVPLMTLYGVQMHRAVATAAGFGLLIAVPSVLAFLFVSVPNPPPGTIGAVNVLAFGIAISMTFVTAPLGARFAHALPAVALRRSFSVFILIVAVNMLRQVSWS